MDCRHFTFGSFALDTEKGLLTRNGSPISLGQRGIALLAALLKADGRPVPKAELMDIAWRSQVVEENNLSVQIATLRKCLGRQPDGNEWIATVARIGYRFIGRFDATQALPVSESVVAEQEVGMKPSIAVLPFDNADSDSANDLFIDGVSEDIVNGLSRFSSLFVIARHSSFRFRGTTDIGEAARQLGVRYLVTGSLRRSGDRLRISVQLVDASTGRQVWSNRLDRPLSDLFALQDEIVQLIVASLTGQVEILEIRSAAQKPTASLEAYDYLLRGIDFLRRYEEGANRKAIDMFERAIARDPSFGLAHGYLALALLVENRYESAPEAIKERALKLALEGVRLAPGDSRCHLYLGDVYLFTRRHELALAQVERAIELNPNDANALTRLALCLARVGRAEEGLTAAHQAIRNNPFHPDYYWSDLAIVAYAARRYEEALAASKRLAVHGQYWHLARVAACLAQLGRIGEARAAVADVLRRKPDFSLHTEFIVYGNDADMQHVKDGMRKAGLPE